MANLIGSVANIKRNIDSIYAGEWGVIQMFDGEYYHIAMWNGRESMVFTRNEFVVRRTQK